STGQLVNSLLVFQLCQIPGLVKMAPHLLDVADRLGAARLLNAIIKRTFFRHFCGGEDLAEVRPTMARLQKSGIGSILDLSIEADMDEDADATGLQGAEALAYAERLAGMFRDSMDIASAQPGSFIALKITSLVPPMVLLRWSNTLRRAREHVAVLSRESPHKDFGLITPQDLATVEPILVVIEQLCRYARDRGVRLMVDAEQSYFQMAIDDLALQMSELLNGATRADKAAAAADKVSAAAPFPGPVVYNTYQMYLKDAYVRLVQDVKTAERAGYNFGAKIVRGAYMISERERAQTIGMPSPICDTIDDTHRNYNAAIDFLVGRAAEHQRAKQLRFVVASHNRPSAEHACRALDREGLCPSDGHVSFAQLYGMNDATTFWLAGHGYPVDKYIPYGPVDVTVPYLLRRAQENSAVLGGKAQLEDRDRLLEAFKQRL
ncbi:hypothetical protein CXG81DRAFT_6783, partial [Caulochytrium protostelioides]